MISEDQSFRECSELADMVASLSGDNEAQVEALRACVAHPCSYHQLDLLELYYDLGALLRDLGRYDESIEAFEAYISAGARCWPHPRAYVAEVLLEAGRLDEAKSIFAELRRQCPDDIWLYNSAGFGYSRIGEYTGALLWLDKAIVMALDDGDRDRILGQLSDERNSCRQALGLSDDELSAQVTAFVPPETRSQLFDPEHKKSSGFGEAYPEEPPCSHCGWDPNYDEKTGIHFDGLGQILGDDFDLAGWLVDQDRENHDREKHDHEPKVGRNAPCPCGSGRKYKYCCNS